MAEAGPGAAGGYVAFISYSHKDSAIGRWLHRKLEGYRLPRRLAGTQGEDGEVPARLTPIFRDREELPAAGDLGERVAAALALSRNLIVICSPHSAASPWVAKEIATFRELHPDRPIFTAIVEGEPDRCFPPGLRVAGAEPLAADLRKEGDGPRLGLLKLVAGLTGVGLDALVQRDAHRRVRRVTYVTAAAVAAMLMMALLTAFALKARAEAERQRQQAEGLVEFMLTDLRTKVKGVGSLEVLEAVNRRAFAYYSDGVTLSSLPDESLERRARILHAMGEDYEKRGDLETALSRFREAHTSTAATLSRHPSDAAAIFAHGQSEYWIGHVHELRRRWPEARRQYGLYARSAQRLVDLDPGNPDYMMEMGWGSLNLGLVELRGANRPSSAQRMFEQSIIWFSKAAAARRNDPSILAELANAYSCLAETFYARELWVEAKASYLDQYRVTRQIRSLEPDNLDVEYRMAIAERAVARLSRRLGDEATARSYLTRSVERSNALVARDPLNAEWLLFNVKTKCDLLQRPNAPKASTGPLIQGISASAKIFAAQNNPRVSEIARCLSEVSNARSTQAIRG